MSYYLSRKQCHHEDQSVNQLSISKLALTDQGIDFNNFFVIGTCNGLVCLSDYASLLTSSATFILMNPFINKYVVLPKSSYGSLESSNEFDGACTSSGFCFDPKNNDFLVVKVFLYYTKRNPPWVELYSHNTGKWRTIIGRGPSLRFSVWGITSDQVFVNGALHWLVSGAQFGRNSYVTIILSFDFATETFGELILPRCLEFRADIDFYLLKGVNSLTLVRKTYVSICYIWVMKEYGNVDSWNMIFSFDLTRHGHIERVIAMRNSGELVLERRDDEVIFFDPKKDLVRRYGLQGYDVGFVGDIEESLFLINEENNASLISRLVL
ncbi:hypothetical protein K1719_035326 [Acacia pycnantha]|nr:hypothetical protein K1719_035326 [Acacia pycnantha]